MADNDRYAVVLTRTADPLLLSGILAGTLRIPRFEASKKTLMAPGIPARDLTGDEARQLQGELRRNGVDSLVLAEQDMPELPPASQVKGARFDDDSLYLCESAHRSEARAWKLPWSLHLFLCCGRVKVTTEERTRETVRRSLPRYSRVGRTVIRTDSGTHRETRVKRKTSSKLFFDMVPLNTPHRFRIIGEDFNYLALGLDQPTVFESLTALIRRISLRCENPFRDGAIDNLLDGDPLTNTAFPCPEAYENHVHRGIVLHQHIP